MVSIQGLEHQVLMYLKMSLDKNQLDGASTKLIAASLDEPIDKVNEACQKLENLHVAHIDKRATKDGKTTDMLVHITNAGIEYLSKEHGIPL